MDSARSGGNPRSLGTYFGGGSANSARASRVKTGSPGSGAPGGSGPNNVVISELATLSGSRMTHPLDRPTLTVARWALWRPSRDPVSIQCPEEIGRSTLLLRDSPTRRKVGPSSLGDTFSGAYVAWAPWRPPRSPDHRRLPREARGVRSRWTTSESRACRYGGSSNGRRRRYPDARSRSNRGASSARKGGGDSSQRALLPFPDPPEVKLGAFPQHIGGEAVERVGFRIAFAVRLGPSLESLTPVSLVS